MIENKVNCLAIIVKTAVATCYIQKKKSQRNAFITMFIKYIMLI